MKTFLSIISVCVILFVGCSEKEISDELTRVLIVVGPTNHAPGTHEVAAGGRLIEYCLENMENISGFEADVIYEWDNFPHPLDSYSTMVLSVMIFQVKCMTMPM